MPGLKEFYTDDLMLTRVLLQNGGDANVITLCTVPHSERAIELLKLLAGYRYHFRISPEIKTKVK